MKFFIIQTVSKIKNAQGAKILANIELGSKMGASPVLAKSSPQREYEKWKAYPTDCEIN